MGLCIVSLFVVYLISAIDCRVSIEKVVYEANSNVLKLNVSIERNADGVGMLNLEAEVLKELTGNLMLWSELSKKAKDKDSYKSMITIPKLNYCEINEKKQEHPLIDILLTQVKKFGNIPTSCPIKKGIYSIKGLLIPDYAFPPIVFSAGTYQNVVKFYDESESNSEIFHIKINLQYDMGILG